MERLPLVTYVLELEEPSRVLFVSPQIEARFGVTLDDLARDDTLWTRSIVEEDRGRFVAAREAQRREGGEVSVEYRVRTPDGQLAWVRDTGVVADGAIHGYLTDITREKELERELAAERAQADAFFRDSTVGMGITDAEGRYLRVNEALARLNGASVEEHIGRTLAEVASGIAAAAGPIVEQVRETGVPIHRREVGVEVDGERRTYVASFFPIEADGETHVGRIVLDATSQRRAEEQHRRLIEQLPLVTYVNDLAPAPRATFVSPQIEELYGYPAEQWEHDVDLWDRVVHPDDLERVVAAEREARAGKGEFEAEYRIVRADGTVRWVVDRMQTICGEDGQALYELGFLVDVTRRHDTEDLFRAMFDRALEAMMIMDDDGRFVDVNGAACEVFGRTREELLQLRVGEIGSPSERPESVWPEFLAAGEAAGAFVARRPDGSLRELEYAAKANVLPGRHLSVARDVTERKALEREVSRGQRLESVARLAGGVAQDFNNLLTAIKGYAQLLQDRVSPASVEYHHAAEIDRAASRAAALTSQLLAFGRRQDLRPRPVELNRLVERVAPALRTACGAEVVFELASDLRAVRVDPASVEQVLLNLVQNAAEAGGADDIVRVRTENADVESIDDLVPGRYVVLSVTDHGAGIDESLLDDVFEPFFTTKPFGEGLGLGLATAYGIVKQSGGTITVATSAGVGTTFSVYLPEAAGARGGDDAPGETVLAIEPDPELRDALFELLSDAGYRVLTVSTPTDAALVAERIGRRVDLVLTELSGDRAGVVARSAGASGYVTVQKPFSSESLRLAVAGAVAVPRKEDAVARIG